MDPRAGHQKSSDRGYNIIADHRARVDTVPGDRGSKAEQVSATLRRTGWQSRGRLAKQPHRSSPSDRAHRDTPGGFGSVVRHPGWTRDCQTVRGCRPMENHVRPAKVLVGEWIQAFPYNLMRRGRGFESLSAHQKQSASPLSSSRMRSASSWSYDTETIVCRKARSPAVRAGSLSDRPRTSEGRRRRARRLALGPRTCWNRQPRLGKGVSASRSDFGVVGRPGKSQGTPR